VSFLPFPKTDPDKKSSRIDPRDNWPTVRPASRLQYKDGGRGGLAGEGMYVGRACVLTSVVLTRLVHPTFDNKVRSSPDYVAVVMEWVSLTHSRHRRIHAIGTLGLAVGIRSLFDAPTSTSEALRTVTAACGGRQYRSVSFRMETHWRTLSLYNVCTRSS